MRMKRCPLRAGALIKLPRAFVTRSVLVEHGQPVAYIEVDPVDVLRPYAVLAIEESADIPPMGYYLGSVAPAPRRSYFPIPPRLVPRAQHFYLVEVR